VFWEVGGLTKHGVMSWTEASGQQNLIRWLGDYTQGAGNFNTDGVDMVWSHGTGKAPSASKYPTVSIMTAPFTADPAVRKAKEKRLRSDPGQLGVTPFGVGCGYASRVVYDATTDTVDLLVVRLSDGVSWIVKSPPISTSVKFMRRPGHELHRCIRRSPVPRRRQRDRPHPPELARPRDPAGLSELTQDPMLTDTSPLIRMAAAIAAAASVACGSSDEAAPREFRHVDGESTSLERRNDPTGSGRLRRRAHGADL
jgi:hypothetical protein